MSCGRQIPFNAVDSNKRLARFGHYMRQHQSLIRTIQWLLVGFYIALVAIPAFLPLPLYSQHIWNNLTLLAQFLFWGIWWPFVLLSMVFMGRMWCGVFCPEGTITEFASKHGLKRAIPRWVRWGGWPFVAFIGTTVYGQMISVYQYPKATLLILGGSTAGAIVVGYLYGKEKRVWCRYLCPVNGVFGLLAKLAPVHYLTDRNVWSAKRAASNRIPVVNCPTLLPLSKLESASDCHMCGRCSGHNDAITLTSRKLGSEIYTSSSSNATLAEFLLITFGMGGVAVGAFHWSASPWFVEIKQQLASWLITHNGLWVLQTSTPWWIFTNYQQQNDVFNLLDGALLLAYIALTGLVLGAIQSVCFGLANRTLGRWSTQRLYHLSYSLIPVVGCGIFLGLSSLTISFMRTEHLYLAWVSPLRVSLLTCATAWSAYLLHKLANRYTKSIQRHTICLCFGLIGIGSITYAWYLLFWGWH